MLPLNCACFCLRQQFADEEPGGRVEVWELRGIWDLEWHISKISPYWGHSSTGGNDRVMSKNDRHKAHHFLGGTCHSSPPCMRCSFVPRVTNVGVATGP